MILVKKNTYLKKVAPIEIPRAFKEPFVRQLTKTSFAIYMKEDDELIFAVLAIILKKTMSKGVMTTAIAALEAIVANSRLMKRYLFPSFSTLLI